MSQIDAIFNKVFNLQPSSSSFFFQAPPFFIEPLSSLLSALFFQAPDYFKLLIPSSSLLSSFNPSHLISHTFHFLLLSAKMPGKETFAWIALLVIAYFGVLFSLAHSALGENLFKVFLFQPNTPLCH
ncbi:hypothetical protein ES288_A10G296500v1 [Gossypium darwinii]|uniref:Uncharacterized protein n=1 Tax=Gossypium darwinii TaxID=34276 RepID=A0A5D2F3J2_GOSDA|nr:hypothetical protein ES288_A10G296500v1 [Gossypium darwinii]